MGENWVAEIEKWVSEFAARNQQEQTNASLGAVCALISKNFGVQPHEVAILALGTDGSFLRFLFPENLRPVGQIPLTSTASLAARTVRERRAEVINHFAAVPHASVFEGLPIGEQRGEAIQKILSCPVLCDTRVVGAIQVSRRGKSPGDAGPDFTAAQLQELKAIALALAPWIAAADAS